MQAPARAKQLQALKLRVEIVRLRAEQTELRADVHAENDLRREEARMQALQEELAQAALNEKSLDATLCCGKPDWSGEGELWSGWREGVEVVYSTVSPAVDPVPAAASSAAELVSCTHCSARLQLYARPFAQGGLQNAFYARRATQHGIDHEASNFDTCMRNRIMASTWLPWHSEPCMGPSLLRRAAPHFCAGTTLAGALS